MTAAGIWALWPAYRSAIVHESTRPFLISPVNAENAIVLASQSEIRKPSTFWMIPTRRTEQPSDAYIGVTAADAVDRQMFVHVTLPEVDVVAGSGCLDVRPVGVVVVFTVDDVDMFGAAVDPDASHPML